MKIIVTNEEIQKTVKSLAEKIERNNKPLLFIPIMTGAMIFCSDLIRQIKLKTIIKPIFVNSFKTKIGKQTNILYFDDFLIDRYTNYDYWIIDDSIHSGTSISEVYKYLSKIINKPINSIVLFKKPYNKNRFSPTLVGIEISGLNTFGYGSDGGENFRNLNSLYLG